MPNEQRVNKQTHSTHTHTYIYIHVDKETIHTFIRMLHTCIVHTDTHRNLRGCTDPYFLCFYQSRLARKKSIQSRLQGQRPADLLTERLGEWRLEAADIIVDSKSIFPVLLVFPSFIVEQLFFRGFDDMGFS